MFSFFMSFIPSSDINARIDRGVALLDERRPGWQDEIDLSRLDLAIAEDCVLGQLFGRYEFGMARLVNSDRKMKMTGTGYGWANRFNCPEYPRLTKAWKRRIRKLRSPVESGFRSEVLA